MGRRKSSMELISNEKSRILTYRKRKKGLMKKAYEFATLCGVDVCVIIHGPKLEERSADVEIWPENPNEVEGIINKYRSAKGKDLRVEKIQYLSDFFAFRRTKVEDEIAKLRLAYLGKKFPTWDDRLDCYSLDHLRVLEALFESKLEAANGRLLMLKSEHLFVDDYNNNKSGTLLGCASNMQLSLTRPPQQQISLPCVKPLDMQLASSYQSGYQANQAPPFGYAGDNCSMMMMLMKGQELGGPSTSGGYIPYTPLDDGSASYDHNSGSEIHNVMFNITPAMALATGYYDPETNYHMVQPYRHHVSSQFQPTQFSAFCGLRGDGWH